MPLDLIIPIAGFLIGFVGIVVAMRIVRDLNTARRKAELQRARLERNWKDGRFDA